MNAWILFQILVNLILTAGLVTLWIRLGRPAKDDPRMSKGLQLLQSKISILEDLSDRTDTQVQQLTALLDLPKVPGHTELMTQVSTRGLLDAEGVVALRRLLLRMSSVETMVVFQRSGGMVQPIRDNEVVSIARTVKQLLDAAQAASASAHSRPSLAPGTP